MPAGEPAFGCNPAGLSTEAGWAAMESASAQPWDV
jgi:hypothetical protein